MEMKLTNGQINEGTFCSVHRTLNRISRHEYDTRCMYIYYNAPHSTSLVGIYAHIQESPHATLRGSRGLIKVISCHCFIGRQPKFVAYSALIVTAYVAHCAAHKRFQILAVPSHFTIERAAKQIHPMAYLYFATFVSIFSVGRVLTK